MWRTVSNVSSSGQSSPSQRPVDEDHLVLGVVDDVGELLGEQPDVERVQHPAAARRGEVELEVAGGVPAEGGDPAVGARCRGRRARRRGGGCARPTRRRCARSMPAAVAVTISLSGKRRSARCEEVRQRERAVLHQALHRAIPLVCVVISGQGAARDGHALDSRESWAPEPPTLGRSWPTAPRRSPARGRPTPAVAPAGGGAGRAARRAGGRGLRRRRPGPDPGGHPPGLAHRPQRPQPQPGRWSPTSSTRGRYYGIGTVRLLVSDPLFFLLGYWYGDAAVTWMERRTTTWGQMLRQIERMVRQGRVPARLHRPQQLHLPVRRGGGHAAAGVLRRQHGGHDDPAVADPAASARRSSRRIDDLVTGSATTAIRC